jgi:chromate transporter
VTLSPQPPDAGKRDSARAEDAAASQVARPQVTASPVTKDACAPSTAATPETPGHWAEVFLAFLRLGLTSFGGPVAHLGYFRQDIVERRRWLDERAYVDLVALAQFLPGPSSSEVGIGIGLVRAGLPGALAAWAGFTLPSAIALTLFAFGIEQLAPAAGAGWLHGLKVAAVAVVAQAVWGMAQTMAAGRSRATLAVAAAVIVLFSPTTAGQLSAIGSGAVLGAFLFRRDGPPAQSRLVAQVGRGTAVVCLVAFFVLLAAALLAAGLPRGSGQTLAVFGAFYRAGSLVFGGGHVVLPLLQAAVVPPGWVTDNAFLAGYGAAQAVPGPLFTFAAFLGAVSSVPPNGIAGAALALAAIFLPAFLLVIGVLPFWQVLRTRPAAQAALNGVNAAVVGLLAAALYNPVWRSAITEPGDFALALAAFLLLTVWRTPPWLVVVLSAAGGAALSWIG